jgi:exodeoxyribonuclease VII large subunit
MTSLSLSELLKYVQEVLTQNYERSFWIRAEIGELHENGAHCYMELIEKDEDSDALLAKIRATCWASTYRMLKPYFENATGETLRAGLSVLVSVSVDFHALYGISLNVKDIDPVFTIGDLAARRLQIIRRLEEEGIADMNKELPFSQLPQRLAVISSATAAGYGDFCHQLEGNERGFKFYPVLFPAVVQGEAAVPSIIAALDKIFENQELFDAVVIIRGGGAATDLACFDSYDLALNCAQFPLPILTGIGHQRDVSIVDMVANRSLKTPTAVAEFLIGTLQDTENQLFETTENIVDAVRNLISGQEYFLENIKWKITQRLKSSVERENFELKRLKMSIENATHNAVNFQENRLTLLENKINALSPLNLLKRGYSITLTDNQRLTSSKDVKAGQKIKTILYDGSFESEVK